MRTIRNWAANHYHQLSLRRVLNASYLTHYRFLGIKRSGNHAIISWILNGLDGLSSHCNDLSPKDPPQKAPIKQTKWGSNKQTNLLCSYEDYFGEEIFSKETQPTRNSGMKRIDILILRDPFNLVASWLAWKSVWGESFRKEASYRENILSIWKNHASYFVGKPKSYTIELINYNSWVSSHDYRENLAKRLALSTSGSNLPQVSKFGFGSSFDGLTHLHTPEKMAVLTRWEQVRDQPIFKSVADIQEIKDLSYEIFGEIIS